MLRYRDAVAKDRSQYIARKRKAIQDRREREERARIAKIEAAQKQQAFEAASKRGEARAALATALAAYQEARDQVHTLESALVEAKAHQSAVRAGADINNGDKLAKALGSARDQVEAAEIRLERATPLLHDASRMLLEAISGARAEFIHFVSGGAKRTTSAGW